MGNNNYTKYDEDFKKSLVSLHQNGKTQSQRCKEYGVSQSALGKWVKQYSTVEVGDGELLTAKQVKELQKRNAQLEEENLIIANKYSQELMDDVNKALDEFIKSDKYTELKEKWGA